MEAAIVYMWTVWYSAPVYIFKQGRREQKPDLYVDHADWLKKSVPFTGGKAAVFQGRTWFSSFRVCGVLQNSHLKQAKLGTLEYSGVNQAITV